MIKIKTSVIIPTRNRAESINSLLNCLSKQTIQPGEVIVIDNGSSDQTRSIVKQHSLKVKYYAEKKIGPSFARNKGIRSARGEYLIFLDDDYLLENNFIENILKCSLLREKYLLWFNTSFKFKNMNLPACFFLAIFEAKAKIQALEWSTLGKIDNFQKTRSFLPSAFVISRKCLKESGIWFDEEYFTYFGEGPDLAIRLANKGLNFIRSNEIKVVHFTNNLTFRGLCKRSVLFGMVFSSLKMKYKPTRVDKSLNKLFSVELKRTKRNSTKTKLGILVNSYLKYWKVLNFPSILAFPIFSFLNFLLIAIGVWYGYYRYNKYLNKVE